MVESAGSRVRRHRGHTLILLCWPWDLSPVTSSLGPVFSLTPGLGSVFNSFTEYICKIGVITIASLSFSGAPGSPVWSLALCQMGRGEAAWAWSRGRALRPCGGTGWGAMSVPHVGVRAEWGC